MVTEQPGTDQPTGLPSVIFSPSLQPTPDYYADSFRMVASPYTVSLHFGVQVEQNIVQDTAIVRMSPQHAKMMAILFVRRMKEYERDLGAITIPDKLLETKEINLERDWNAL